MYALVDCNNFFVSCERIFNPALNGRPVVVLSGNDGCVIARSNEAKALGIAMGQPAFELRELFERNNVAIYSSNHILYGDISRRIMSLLSYYSPDVEVYSIDEAFLRLDGVVGEDAACEYAKSIVDEIQRCIGVPVSVGVAATKTLAKIASRRAKKMPRYNSVCALLSPDQIAIALMECSVADVWGVGRRLAPRMMADGIATAWELSLRQSQVLRRCYSVEVERTHDELNGIVCYADDEHPEGKQSLTVSRTFGQALLAFDDLYEAVAHFTATAAARLRRQASAAASVLVFIKGRQRATTCYVGARELLLPVASDSTIELSQYARKALASVYRPGEAYRKAGVILGGIVPRDHVQLSLYDTVDREKHRKLMQVLDEVNMRSGKGTLRLGAEGNRRVWMAKQEHLSPCYTTDIKDILVVKAKD